MSLTPQVKLEEIGDSSRYHVALTDPLPAGMEPMNTGLKGNFDGLAAKREFGRKNASASAQTVLEYDPWWKSKWYEHQNLRDFRAEAFASILRGGTYDYSYLMRATTPGEYIVPPAKIEEMYTPETFGRTATEHVIIDQ